jgi:hypothetical protein
MLTLLSTLALAVPLPVDPAIPVQLELAPSSAPTISWPLAFDVRKGPDGLLYLTNFGNIHTFDPATGAVALFATAQTTAADKLLYQVGWTSDGTLFASEYFGGVSAFSPTGAFLGYTPTGSCMIGLTVTADDRVFTASHCDGEIYEVNPTTGASQLDALMPFNPIYDRSGCVRLYGMANDATGAPWATDLGCDNWEYRRYDDADTRPNTDRWELRYDGDFGQGYGQYFMTFLPDGTGFYSTYPGEIHRVAPDGTATLFATQLQAGGGVGLHYDEATGKLYAFGSDGLWSFDLGAPTPGPTITWSGTCPGPMTLTATGMTPGGSVYVVSSSGPGSAAVPSGPCAGPVSGLSPAGIRLRTTLTANGSGAASFSVTAGAGACGTYVQALDVATCTFSNVDPI